MFTNENEIIVEGENTQPITEQAPTEPMSISEAGRAFLESINSDASAAQNTDIPGTTPAIDGNAAIISETPVAENNTAATLEAIRDSILSEIQSLKQDTVTSTEDVDDSWIDEVIPEISEEGIEIDNDAFMEEFSENPVQAVTNLANKLADQKVKQEMLVLTEKMKPLLDKSEELAFEESVKAVVSEFASKEEFADAESFYPKMAEIINAKGLPKDDINTYISAYKDAALEAARAGQGKSLDDYMADENEFSKITSDPKVREAIINQYLKELASGQKPQVITGGSTIQPAATPPTEFKTFADAKNAFRKQL